MLRRALARADGFALFLAICNDRREREAILDALDDALPGPACIRVRARKETADPLADVLAQVRVEGGSTPVMITDLEEAVPSDGSRLQPLHYLNLRRAAWSESLAHPVVFWVPDYLAALCGREAPDFFDWRSDTVTFPLVPPQRLSEVVPLRGEGALSGFPPASFRRSRLDELLSRLRTTGSATDPTLLRARARWLEEAAEHSVLLGDAAQSEDALREAVAIRRQLDDLRGIGRAFGDYGLALAYAGKLQSAKNAVMEAVHTHQELTVAHPDAAAAQRDLSVSLEKLGDVQLAQGDLSGARASYEQGREIAAKL